MPRLRPKRSHTDTDAIITHYEDENEVFPEANQNTDFEANPGTCEDCSITFDKSVPDRETQSSDVESIRSSIGLLSQKYESLDYDVCENTLYLEEQKKLGHRTLSKEMFSAGS